MIRHAIALALLTVAPTVVQAQAARTQGPVTVEIVSTGQVKVPAQYFRMEMKVTAKGADEAAAAAALAASRAKLAQALSALNVREAEPQHGTPTSMLSLFAGIANRGKPTFTTELTALDDDETNDDAPPQVTASQTLMFDAPGTAAVARAREVAKADGVTVEDEVLPILDDYVGPTRRAKSDALKKAQAEADTYAAALGLRRATVTKVSERQDLATGTFGFIAQLASALARKPDVPSDEVSVQTNLVVEFQLTR